MITTSVASNTRKPGTFHEFDITSAAKGLVPTQRRVALVGAKRSTGTITTLTPTQVTDEAQAETLAGQGSELSLMARKAFGEANHYTRNYGGSPPEIWLVATADGTTAAQHTITITGPATAAGDLEIRIAGRTLRCGVASGDSATTIAAALTAAIVSKYSDLPVSATSALGVVTLVNRNPGPNGNALKFLTVRYPTGTTVAYASSVAGAGVYDITTALDSLADKTYHGVAIANHLAADVSDLNDYIDAAGAPGAKRWSIGYLGENGSLSTATTMATTSNKKEVVIHSIEECPNLPCEIAVATAVAVGCEPDPSRSFDGVELDLYPPPVTYSPTDTEIETALAAGTTISVLNAAQDRVKVVRLVTTKTTENSAVFDRVLDISNVRVLFAVATQIDARWLVAFQRGKNNARTRSRVRSVTLDVLRKCEELEWLQNVDAHLAELIVETDAVVTTRLNVSIPQSVVPNLHQLVGKHVLHIE
ncbi:MAG: hypothetical protein ACEQSX_03620 [Baekduiaceae bacterium]